MDIIVLSRICLKQETIIHIKNNYKSHKIKTKLVKQKVYYFTNKKHADNSLFRELSACQIL